MKTEKGQSYIYIYTYIDVINAAHCKLKCIFQISNTCFNYSILANYPQHYYVSKSIDPFYTGGYYIKWVKTSPACK